MHTYPRDAPFPGFCPPLLPVLVFVPGTSSEAENVSQLTWTTRCLLTGLDTHLSPRPVRSRPVVPELLPRSTKTLLAHHDCRLFSPPRGKHVLVLISWGPLVKVSHLLTGLEERRACVSVQSPEPRWLLDCLVKGAAAAFGWGIGWRS